MNGKPSGEVTIVWPTTSDSPAPKQNNGSMILNAQISPSFLSPMIKTIGIRDDANTSTRITTGIDGPIFLNKVEKKIVNETIEI